MTSPIYRLPPYRRQDVSTSLSETVNWGIAYQGIAKAWEDSQGEGVRVAVLDTGCDITHPDLSESIENSCDFTGSPHRMLDRIGHGTHVAGIIGARANKGGVIGVAPKCKLLIGKVLGDDGSGRGEWIADGIRWAVAQKVDVISMSLGSPQPDSLIRAAIKEAAAHGIIVVCAAGNDGESRNKVNFPAAFEEPFAIASYGLVNGKVVLDEYSSQGPEIDYAAPGSNILSTVPGGRHAIMSGTSMAAPFFSGFLALLIADLKEMDKDFAINRNSIDTLMVHYAIDAGPEGLDTGFGHGLLDVTRMLAAVDKQEAKPVEEHEGFEFNTPAKGGEKIGINW